MAGKLAVAALLVTASAPFVYGVGESTAVARVGDKDVKAAEVRVLLNGIDPKEREALVRDPALLSRTVRALLLQRLVLQEALAKKWDNDPVVAARLERLRENALVESYLDAMAVPPPGFPNESELKAAYEANRPAFLVPRQYRLAQIFIGAPKSPNQTENDKVQGRLAAVAKKVRLPEADFAAIARTESEEPESAARGGEIGWVPENRLQPEIRLRVLGQAKDVVTDPIRLDDGWHIVKILEAKDAYTASLDEVRGQLTATLRAERTKAERQAYVNRLLQQSPISINELAVSGVLEGAGK